VKPLDLLAVLLGAAIVVAGHWFPAEATTLHVIGGGLAGVGLPQLSRLGKNSPTPS
jgi:hypothetical protein